MKVHVHVQIFFTNASESTNTLAFCHTSFLALHELDGLYTYNIISILLLYKEAWYVTWRKSVEYRELFNGS